MSRFLRNKEHLGRMAGLFALGVAAFFVARTLLVPPNFGLYGHYRPGALADNMARPLQFAGAAACVDCHADVVDARKGGKHEGIRCEACHGALAAHVNSPSDVVPKRPNGRDLCLGCHLANVARPRTFPQVQIPEHSASGPCLECHKAHSPAIS